MLDVIIQSVAPVIGSLLGAMLVAAAGYLIKWLRKQTVKIENEMLRDWAETVVNAVEQADNNLQKQAAEAIERPDKKEAAVKAIKSVLAKAGVKASDEAIDAAIEAAVLKLKQNSKN